jgi:hypothetical protein
LRLFIDFQNSKIQFINNLNTYYSSFPSSFRGFSSEFNPLFNYCLQTQPKKY